jgi:hypothetical protein
MRHGPLAKQGKPAELERNRQEFLHRRCVILKPLSLNRCIADVEKKGRRSRKDNANHKQTAQ